MAADCNCSNPSCPCYKGKQDKLGEQQAPGPDAPSTQSSNGSTHGGSAMTAASGEVSTISGLEQTYDQAANERAQGSEMLTAHAAQLEAEAASLSDLAGSMSEHDDETVADLNATAEAFRATAAIIAQGAAAEGEASSLCSSHRQSLTSRVAAARDAASVLVGSTAGLDAYRE